MLNRCKHSTTTMSKIGFNYVCDKCHKVIIELDDSNFDDKYANLSFDDDIYDHENIEEVKK